MFEPGQDNWYFNYQCSCFSFFGKVDKVQCKGHRKGKPFSYNLEEEDSKRTKELIDRSNCRHVIRRGRNHRILF